MRTHHLCFLEIISYIYCSVQQAEKAQEVEHFWDKKLHEDYISSQGVPFISLRPGAFLDQATDYLGDGLKRGDSFALSMWNKTVPLGMIYTKDLAVYFAAAIELPKEAEGECLSVGWTRPVSYEEVVSIAAAKADREMSCYTLPYFLRVTIIYTVGLFSPLVREIVHMFNWFDTGLYVNIPEEHKRYFGEPPTPEDAIGRYVDKVLKEKAKREEPEKSA